MKRKMKGFTLVELIVVMAIIAVLAAILVPTMLGFMQRARYTQANANAKAIYTAVNTAISDYCIDHKSLPSGHYSKIYHDQLNDFRIGGVEFPMQDFLEGMEGTGSMRLNATGTGIDYARWSMGDPSSPGGNCIDTSTGKVLKSAQESGKAIDNSNNPIGCYPLA